MGVAVLHELKEKHKPARMARYPKWAPMSICIPMVAGVGWQSVRKVFIFKKIPA